MSSYLSKLIALCLIAGVGAGLHLGFSWPVQLKAAPDDPTESVLRIPGGPVGVLRIPGGPVGAGGDPAPENPAPDAPADAPTDASDETPPAEPGDQAGDEPAAGADTAAGATEIRLTELEIDDLETVRLLHEHGMATFIDARPADKYEAGHIADAMHITPQMLDNTTLFVLDVIDPDKPIVIYCDGGDCDDSHRVAELLQQLRGLTRTHVYVGGYPAWEAAGLPTATGPDPWAE